MEKEQYLPEDKDILDELDSTSMKTNMIAMADQERKIGILQIKATLRSRKTMVDLDSSNKRFSIVVLALTFIQFVVACFQLILQFVDAEDRTFAMVLSVVFFVVIYFVIRDLDQLIGKSK